MGLFDKILGKKEVEQATPQPVQPESVEQTATAEPVAPVVAQSTPEPAMPVTPAAEPVTAPSESPAAPVESVAPITAPSAEPTAGPSASVPRILAVGDIISSSFIKLTEEYFEKSVDEKGYTRLTFELGAKLPYDELQVIEAVECSPNAAVSLSRLGITADLMSWIGDDDTGKSMVAYLKTQSVGTDSMVTESGMKSNRHFVLRYGADRTKLQRFEAYSYEWKDPAVKPDWLYLGVLGKDTWHTHEAILDYLNRNPDIKLMFQPGMYHLQWGSEKMAEFYKKAEMVILNREEAAQVTGHDRGNVSDLLDAMHGLGVTVVVITDGPAGAYASDGTKKLFMPNYPDPVPPYDRLGAGDAFASTITAALALGETLETALKWAPINSMSVVQKLGAQAGLLDKESIQRYLSEAPTDYAPRPLDEAPVNG